jgi:hypothetical protein
VHILIPPKYAGVEGCDLGNPSRPEGNLKAGLLPQPLGGGLPGSAWDYPCLSGHTAYPTLVCYPAFERSEPSCPPAAGRPLPDETVFRRGLFVMSFRRCRHRGRLLWFLGSFGHGLDLGNKHIGIAYCFGALWSAMNLDCVIVSVEPPCSTAQSGLCHETSIRPVARPHRSSARILAF